MSLRSRAIRLASRCLQRDEFRFAGGRFHAAEGVLNPTAFRLSMLFAREAIRGAPAVGRALELGCGIGLAAVCLARRGLSTTAVDRDPEAVRATVDNARRNGVAIDAQVSDWDAAIREDLRFEWIVANPPFLATEQAVFNHALFGGENLEVLVECGCAMARRLAPGGRGLVMTSERSGRTSVEGALNAAKLERLETFARRHWGERYVFDIVQSRAT
jgi:methylase of polypeptide subunit release factors